MAKLLSQCPALLAQISSLASLECVHSEPSFRRITMAGLFPLYLPQIQSHQIGPFQHSD